MYESDCGEWEANQKARAIQPELRWSLTWDSPTTMGVITREVEGDEDDLDRELEAISLSRGGVSIRVRRIG